MEFTQQVIIIFSLIILTFISIYTFLNRKVLGAYPLLIEVVVTILWTIASLLELSTYSLESKLFWRNIQQIGIFIGSICTVFFAIDYSKQIKLRKYAYMLATVPVATLILIFTDQFHHIMRSSYKIVENDIFGRVLVVKSTAIGSILVVFNFCIPILTVLILLDFMRRVSKHYKKSVLLVILSFFINDLCLLD
jgi:hypothetical protein